MHIHRDEFHPEWQIRMGLPSLIVITIFLILIREIRLGTMENVLPMFDCCTINHPSIHLMRATEVSLRRREQKYILQLIQALQNVHLFLLDALNQFCASFSALKESGWQKLHLLLTLSSNEDNVFIES